MYLNCKLISCSLSLPCLHKPDGVKFPRAKAISYPDQFNYVQIKNNVNKNNFSMLFMFYHNLIIIGFIYMHVNMI